MQEEIEQQLAALRRKPKEAKTAAEGHVGGEEEARVPAEKAKGKGKVKAAAKKADGTEKNKADEMDKEKVRVRQPVKTNTTPAKKACVGCKMRKKKCLVTDNGKVKACVKCRLRKERCSLGSVRKRGADDEHSPDRLRKRVKTINYREDDSEEVKEGEGSGGKAMEEEAVEMVPDVAAAATELCQMFAEHAVNQQIAGEQVAANTSLLASEFKLIRGELTQFRQEQVAEMRSIHEDMRDVVNALMTLARGGLPAAEGSFGQVASQASVASHMSVACQTSEGELGKGQSGSLTMPEQPETSSATA